METDVRDLLTLRDAAARAARYLAEAEEHLASPRGNWELARIKAEIGHGYATLAASGKLAP